MEKGKTMMIVIIALLVVLMGIIVGAAFYIVDSMKPAEPAEQEAEGIFPLPTDKLTLDQITLFKLSSTINTNLRAEAEGDNYGIRISLQIGIDNRDADKAAAFIEKLTEKEPFVRNIILDVVRDMTYSEAKKSDAHKLIAEEVKSRLQELFTENLIVQVIVDEFYVN